LAATGTDVVASMNGLLLSGAGQMLKGSAGTIYEGLELMITATEAGPLAFRVSSGIADRMVQRIEEYIDANGGILKIRQDGLNATISGLSDRMAAMEERVNRTADRLRSQFNAMEVQLSKLQTVQSYVDKMVASLNSLKNS